MADPNTRQGKRTPVTLKIKFKSETLEQFIERYAVDVSQGGIFIRTKEPLAVGTQMKFEFQLRDASPLIAGEGTVVWTRENDPSRPAIAPGMGVRFDKLAEGSQQVLEKILAEKAKQAPQRAHTEQTKPPMFTDTPTRVAPAPVQDALLGTKSGASGPSGKTPRARSDSEQTPLPKPMPFHSDADEYPEEAFEEATKVRSLDELVAATAETTGEKGTATNVMPRDELAARRNPRADSTLADPPAPSPEIAPKSEVERESAPGLPSPPESGRKVLDTSPSPRTRPSEERIAETPPAEPAKTKLGLEPAKVATKEASAAPRAVAAEPTAPRSKPSNAPIIIGALVVVAAGLAALWFFVLREPAAEKAAAQNGTAGSAMLATGSDQGGSAEMPGSNAAGSADTGSAGSATTMAAGSAVTAPPANGVDTVVASPAAKAMIDVEGQSGAAPFTAKLEKGKQYKAHVTAPGFVAKDAFVTGGEKATIKLDPKPHTLTVTSDPAGAEIYIDGASTGKQTPADVNLSAAQAAKPKLHVVLRKGGYKALDQTVDTSTFTETDAKVTGTFDGKLDKAPVVNYGGGGGTHASGGNAGTGAGSATTTSGGTGAGSATTTSGGTGAGSATSGTGTSGSSGTSGTGAGSAATPTPPTSTEKTGTGSATATPPAAGGEPEPDWSKKP